MNQPSRRRMWTLVLGLACTIGAGCAGDDSGQGSGEAGADAGRDAAARLDTGLGPDTTPDASVDTTPDVEIVETCGTLGEPCCGGLQCDPGLSCSSSTCVTASQCPATPACLEPIPSSPDVPIDTLAGDPPVLAGGSLIEGDYILTGMTIYPEYTFAALVDSVDVTSNGGTWGSLVIQGPDWGFDAYLDLYIDIVALGLDFGQPFQQQLVGGGCYVVSGNQMQGDMGECGGAWPEGTDPPDSLDFETAPGTLDLLLILERDTILASVPEDQRWAADIAIIDDLPILLTFEPTR